MDGVGEMIRCYTDGRKSDAFPVRLGLHPGDLWSQASAPPTCWWHNPIVLIKLWPTAGSKIVWSWEWILRPWFCQKGGIVPLKSFGGHVSSNCLQERLEELMDFLLRVAGLSFEAVRRRRVPVPLHQENSAEVVGGIWSGQLTEMCQCF